MIEREILEFLQSQDGPRSFEEIKRRVPGGDSLIHYHLKRLIFADKVKKLTIGEQLYYEVL